MGILTRFRSLFVEVMTASSTRCRRASSPWPVIADTCSTLPLPSEFPAWLLEVFPKVISLHIIAKQNMKRVSSVLHRPKTDTSGKPGVWGQGPDTAIKAQHGCLAKIDTGGQFGCSSCLAGKSTPAGTQCRYNVRKMVASDLVIKFYVFL